MARYDFRPYLSTVGGIDQIQGFSMAAGADFDEGEPVVLTAGALGLAGNDPGEVAGIAAQRSVDVDNNALATNTRIAVYQPVDTQLWVTVNFATDGASTPAVPTQADIGTTGGFSLDAGTGVWYVDTGLATTLVFIEDVLNARGASITDPTVGGGPGFAVVFRFM